MGGGFDGVYDWREASTIGISEKPSQYLYFSKYFSMVLTEEEKQSIATYYDDYNHHIAQTVGDMGSWD